jgi:membrane protein implicated in regulation of membrane protease activity
MATSLRCHAFGPQCGVINTKEACTMSEPTYWWLLTGALIVVELLSGTFYLLMLAIGTVGAALAAHSGLPLVAQIVISAALGGGAVVAWHWRKSASRGEPPAQSNPNVNLDIGETVHIASWNVDGSANVQYRGANWTAIHRPGIVPSVGPHRVAELVGNRLLVDKA